MRVLFIQHDHVSPTGPIGEQFANRGYDVVEHLVVPAANFDNPNITAEFPDPTDFDVVVPMGAPWSVYDADRIGHWIEIELALLRKAQDADVPMLGICFGGQALAAALGGAVEKAPVPELGWREIRSDRPELVATGPWLQYHHDRWITPAGAAEIARTDHGPQAFVIGRTLAVQFHPEITAASLLGWCELGGYDDLAAHGVDAHRLLDETALHEVASCARARSLVDEFLDQVATRT